MTEPLGQEPLEGGCKWISTYEHALLTLRQRNPETPSFTCCHCKTRTEYTDGFVTMAVGKHGNRLPLPAFMHCRICMLTLDPQWAWMSAYQKDKAASLPDPVKVAREEEWNRKLNPFLNPDLHE